MKASRAGDSRSRSKGRDAYRQEQSGNRLEDVAVQGFVDGAWLDGWLDTWQKRSNVWGGYMRYATAPGENRLDWFQQAQFRRP